MMSVKREGRGGEPTSYSPAEIMTVMAARELRDGDCVFVGIGLPNVACNLARRRHAPTVQMIFESGVYGADPERQPLSIGDPTLVTGATSVCSMTDIFSLYLQGGYIDVGVLGGAQIDRFGNMNTTVIGDYARPEVRLPGSGGACEIAHLARSVIVVMRLKGRAFVEQLDFLTSPGFLTGGDARERAGIGGEGPRAVITDRAVFRFHPETKEMVLASVHPGTTVDEVRELVGWPLRIAPEVATTTPPDAEDLRIIREELDPQGIHVVGR